MSSSLVINFCTYWSDFTNLDSCMLMRIVKVAEQSFRVPMPRLSLLLSWLLSLKYRLSYSGNFF